MSDTPPVRPSPDVTTTGEQARLRSLFKALNILSWMLVVAWCALVGPGLAFTAAVFFGVLTVLYLCLS